MIQESFERITDLILRRPHAILGVALGVLLVSGVIATRLRHPEGVLTGVNLVSQTLRTITRADAIRATLVGLVLVFAENATETGRAVVLAALMSIVGFASFAISHYPGVRSIGVAAVVGIALRCLASITLLPALLATGRFRHAKASMLGEPASEE